MLPDPTVPASLLAVLGVLRGSFTSPTFSTFAALVTGLIANTGRGTVTGMLLGANLTRHWSHDRAHSFFARARWEPQTLGASLSHLVVRSLVPDGTIGASHFTHAPSRRTYEPVASITTRSTPWQTSLSPSSRIALVVEATFQTCWIRRPLMVSCGTRRQTIPDALAISIAATLATVPSSWSSHNSSMRCPLSCRSRQGLPGEPEG